MKGGRGEAYCLHKLASLFAINCTDRNTLFVSGHFLHRPVNPLLVLQLNSEPFHACKGLGREED